MTQAFNLAQLANNLNSSGQLDATDGLFGAIPVPNGGTGQTSLTANNVLLGNGTSGIQVVAPGTTGNALISNGSTWTSAAIPNNSIGVGQTYQQFNPPTRQYGVTYTNSTGKPIFVALSGYGSTMQIQLTVSNAGTGTTTTGSNGLNAFICAIVPDGATYIAQIVTGGATFGSWMELR